MSIGLLAVLRLLLPLLACSAAIAAGVAEPQVNAERTAQAFVAYEEGRFSDAQRLYLSAARDGDPLAAYNVAVIRLGDESDQPSEAEAVALLEASAAAGFALAQHMLGALHERGWFVTESQSLAVSWYRKAAEQGHADAQLALATQYFLGRGTALDYAEAARWYEKAAEGGDAGAQYIIASMYEHGTGVEADPDKALGWYSAAARQGDVAAELKAKEIASRLGDDRR
jgi:TPR repeat protein